MAALDRRWQDVVRGLGGDGPPNEPLSHCAAAKCRSDAARPIAQNRAGGPPHGAVCCGSGGDAATPFGKRALGVAGIGRVMLEH